jgi:hypothetical protein
VVVNVYVGTENEYSVEVELLGVTSATLAAGVEDAWLVAVEGGREVSMRLGPMLWRSR